MILVMAKTTDPWNHSSLLLSGDAIMARNEFRIIALAAVLIAFVGPAPSTGAAEDSKEVAQLLKALPTSQHSLIAGIEQAAAKSPETAISAKFEMEDGKLSLSVYTAEKGPNVAADQNVLKELAGNPV